MLFNRIYYQLKPILPPVLRIGLRRLWAKRKRKYFRDVWPINPAAAKAPEGWQGWPDGKQFALVLTHDVEGQRGLKRCRELMELEKTLEFRSSFNFIPEGPYETPCELRGAIAREGFEVGVHDLSHDGKLFWSRDGFRQDASVINRYLAEWGAKGFRSAFMLRNSDWLHDLNIEYDASTFDTDPFEPQPEGVQTIFPFWIPAPDSLNARPSPGPSTINDQPSTHKGYVELPYTLPQDSTVFRIFQEPTVDIWKRKLDWVAERGGMALMNTHPDYMNFDQVPARDEFDAALYENFLSQIKKEYDGAYWHALPREVAACVKRPEPIRA